MSGWDRVWEEDECTFVFGGGSAGWESWVVETVYLQVGEGVGEGLGYVLWVGGFGQQLQVEFEAFHSHMRVSGYMFVR